GHKHVEAKNGRFSAGNTRGYSHYVESVIQNSGYPEIANFFDRRSTNAASESFNAKIKEFRTQFREVKDKVFFLFRLTKIYA
uniref:transposase n=1 Tax=uncultured Bacteroides sp. TaxID=162156 RepID=UPI00262EC629